MRRGLVYFLFASPLLAQTVQPGPEPAPIDVLVQSYRSASNNGRFDEAAAKRDQARALLSGISVDHPRFVAWVQQVVQAYDDGGFAVQSRGVLEQALARTGGLREPSPVRIALLEAIADSWEQDRNLVKAVSYLEQAAAAVETTPPHEVQTPSPAPRSGGTLSATPVPVTRVQYAGSTDADIYRRLFELYRLVGRPQDAAAVLTRVAAHVKNDNWLLPWLYQQNGQIDEAAAIHRRQAEQAANPQQSADELESVANLYQNDRRFGDAAAALRQAIAKLETSGDPNSSQRTAAMRLTLANTLQQAGQTEAADEAYRQLLAGPTDRQTLAVTRYANFLEETNRVDQAEKLLEGFQASQWNADPQDEYSLAAALAKVEILARKQPLAEEYIRRSEAIKPRAPRNEETGFYGGIQAATEAIAAGKWDDAFNFTLRALDSAKADSRLEQVERLASLFASQPAPAKSDEIYRLAIALAAARAAATVAPLLAMEQSYMKALGSQQRWTEFDQAIERYNSTLTAVRGVGTGWLEDAMRLRAGYLNPERRQDALAASQELAKLEQSIGGDTSKPYLRSIETLVAAIEANGDSAATIPFRRQAISISDVVCESIDWTPATLRIDAALALAKQRQFDEADRLASEAAAISRRMRPPQPDAFKFQLRQILQMKQAAQPSPPKQ